MRFFEEFFWCFWLLEDLEEVEKRMLIWNFYLFICLFWKMKMKVWNTLSPFSSCSFFTPTFFFFLLGNIINEELVTVFICEVWFDENDPELGCKCGEWFVSEANEYLSCIRFRGRKKVVSCATAFFSYLFLLFDWFDLIHKMNNIFSVLK